MSTRLIMRNFLFDVTDAITRVNWCGISHWVIGDKGGWVPFQTLNMKELSQRKGSMLLGEISSRNCRRWILLEQTMIMENRQRWFWGWNIRRMTSGMRKRKYSRMTSPLPLWVHLFLPLPALYLNWMSYFLQALGLIHSSSIFLLVYFLLWARVMSLSTS